MKLYKSIIVPLLGLMAVSCSDFLDGKSQDQILVQTTKDYSELIYGAGYPGANATFLNLTDNMTDDADWIMNQSTNKKQQAADDESFMTAYCWQPTLYEWGTRVLFNNTEYYSLYSYITGCNAVLDGVDEAVGLQSERDRIKAEALTSRSLLYFYLVNLYGEPYNYDKTAPGVPLKLTAAVNEYGLARNSVDEVYEQVENDLLEAIDLMKPLPLNEKDYHVNLPAIYTILSRVYLFEERWQDAADMATEALKINSRVHDLTQEDPTATKLFTANSYNSAETYWCYGNISYNLNKQPSDALLDLFDENDMRYSLDAGLYLRGVLENDPNYSGYGSAPQVYIGSYSVPKCNNRNVVNEGSAEMLPSLSIRVSEALLNRAEAYAKLGRDSEALTDVEKIRVNRIKGYTEASEADINDMLQYVRDERRREFCFEGFRWFDLRRYGMPKVVHRFQTSGSTLYYVLNEKDPMYTLPLPSTVVELNPLLTQNPSSYTSPRSANTTY